MESDQSKDMKVAASRSHEVVSGTGAEQFQGEPAPAPASAPAPNTNNGGQQGGLARQPSMTKTNCLCSPTTHAGSFRCRLHRNPTLQRTKSVESDPLRDQVHASMVDDAAGDVNKDRMH